MKIGVVAVGYNRPDSMFKLLNSLKEADYENDIIDLIVSIDKGKRQNEIIEVANNIEWFFGEKKIRSFTERQGLRNHIIKCGDLTEIYDLVIVLEDDLLVSKFYYNYVKQAVDFYKDNDRIAGISLYKHQIHPGVHRPFEPVNNGYDVYLQQFAMSWGQCWTKSMWQEFKKWYIKNEGKELERDGKLPAYISRWNDQSWLKYYMRYIVESNKYFVYPYFALSTNSSDIGEHCKIPNNDYQISLMQGKINYRLPLLNDAIKYDVFFERLELDDIFPELTGRKVLDLYGNRENYNDGDYLISTSILPYKIIQTIQLKFRPIEMNCITPTNGNGIYIYDLKEIAKKNRIDYDVLTRYDVRAIHWKYLLHLGFSGFIEAIILRFNRG